MLHIVIGKGGVGKSTLCLLLAQALSSPNRKVCVFQMDKQNNVGTLIEEYKLNIEIARADFAEMDERVNLFLNSTVLNKVEDYAPLVAPILVDIMSLSNFLLHNWNKYTDIVVDFPPNCLCLHLLRTPVLLKNPLVNTILIKNRVANLMGKPDPVIAKLKIIQREMDGLKQKLLNGRTYVVSVAEFLSVVEAQKDIIFLNEHKFYPFCIVANRLKKKCCANSSVDLIQQEKYENQLRQMAEGMKYLKLAETINAAISEDLINQVRLIM